MAAYSGAGISMPGHAGTRASKLIEHESRGQSLPVSPANGAREAWPRNRTDPLRGKNIDIGNLTNGMRSVFKLQATTRACRAI